MLRQNTIKSQSPRQIPKTAYQTVSGLYEYIWIPFRLCNPSAAFQRAIDGGNIW